MTRNDELPICPHCHEGYIDGKSGDIGSDCCYACYFRGKSMIDEDEMDQEQAETIVSAFADGLKLATKGGMR